MPNLDLSCADCGKAMQRNARTSRPQGLARCLECRRANPSKRNDQPKYQCASCGGPKWSDGPRPCRKCDHIGSRKHSRKPRVCEVCSASYRPSYAEQRTCGRVCGKLINSRYGQTCLVEWRTCLVCDRLHARRSGKGYETCSDACFLKAKSILFPPKPAPAWQSVEHECPMCGVRFTNAYTTVVVHCSKRCTRKAAKQRRRVREAGTYGEWRWSDFMRMARKFNYCCAYCGDKPERLDPDHVVPLSKDGPNIIGNLLPTCAECNSDKCALDLDEWALSRVARGLPPRHTSWAPEDKRYWHLTVSVSAVAA